MVVKAPEGGSFNGVQTDAMELSDAAPGVLEAAAASKGISTEQLLASINNAVARLLKLDCDQGISDQDRARVRAMAVKPATMAMILNTASQSPPAGGAPVSRKHADDDFIVDDGVPGDEEDEEFTDGDFEEGSELSEDEDDEGGVSDSYSLFRAFFNKACYLLFRGLLVVLARLGLGLSGC